MSANFNELVEKVACKFVETMTTSELMEYVYNSEVGYLSAMSDEEVLERAE